MVRRIQLSARIPADMAGRRLDQALADLFPDYSRSRLQQWLRSGRILLDGGPCRAKQRVIGGEKVVVDAESQADTGVYPQPIELDVRYRDDELLVINKPPGLVVHPAAGNPDGTLQNALLHLDPALAGVPRAGIVHRLDKDTSGLLVVARTLTAHKSLVEQLQQRSVQREYLAVVHGVLPAGGTIEAPVGRHPRDRLRMAVVESGKAAVTHFRVLERFRAHSLLRVRLETGRTHQIRVHMAWRHNPLVGDPLYGGRLRLPAGAGDEVKEALRAFHRQALHAMRLALVHPVSGETLSWEVDMPADMAALVAVLRADREAAEAGP